MRRAISFRKVAPYALLLPGLIWLGLFFVYPAIQMFLVSLWTGNVQDGFEQTWNWGIYPEAFTEYWPWIARSIVYGGLATLLAFALGFPLANGIVLGPLKDLGLVPEDFHLLATPAAVIAGITYNFLPFMTLPLYVALEKIDRRLIEAAQDLYAGPWRPKGTFAGAILGGALGAVVGTWLISEAFIRVTLPLALPGIFAGSLLTFIPAVGDYINAELLGNPQALMIGNVIQARYLQVTDYPTASALSFILMLAILIGLFIYARIIGTEELTGASI